MEIPEGRPSRRIGNMADVAADKAAADELRGML
jgi:hypothetical protein